MINDPIKLNAKIKTNINIQGKLNNNISIKGNLNVTQSNPYPEYTGTYEVIPSIEMQILETKNKILKDDVSVKQIPYFETSNLYGDTAYIGTNIEIN